jgi:hypothetical protein
MAKKSSNIVLILGGILVIVGLLAGLLDQTLSMWQLDNGLFVFHLNSFGLLTNTLNDDVLNLCSADDVTNPGMYLYAGIICIVGSVVAIYGGAKGSKGLGILGVLAIFGGLAYFYYSHVMFIGDNPLLSWIGGMGSAEGFAVVWGENGSVAWRIGNGAFIALAGDVVTLLGAIRNN